MHVKREPRQGDKLIVYATPASSSEGISLDVAENRRADAESRQRSSIANIGGLFRLAVGISARIDQPREWRGMPRQFRGSRAERLRVGRVTCSVNNCCSIIKEMAEKMRDVYIVRTS